MKKIGLIAVDSHHFPNLPLMKLSAWHKQQGDSVEWYQPLLSGHMDRVYVSKVFSFTPDYQYYIDSDEVIWGGSGYCIELVNNKEIYHTAYDLELPPEIEHIYPDYSIYPGMTKDTAYGFMTRGCPRGCNFCHVTAKEGRYSHKVADLAEFWKGQKNIVLLDPNIIACREWEDLLQQLAESSAWVDFSQGIDIRLMTEEMAEQIKKIKIKSIHFAWDRYSDKEKIIPKFEMFKRVTGYDYRTLGVYVLCNFDTNFEQDLERIYILRDMGYSPYVMLYGKDRITFNSELRKLQRWVNSRMIFKVCKNFEDYDPKRRK